MIYIIVSTDDFKEFIKNNPMVLIAFKAGWCHSSNMIAPHCQILAQKYINLKFANADVDYIGEANLQNVDLNLNLGAIPAFYLYKNGILLDKLISGSHLKLQSFIDSYYIGDLKSNSDDNEDTICSFNRVTDSSISWSSITPIRSNTAHSVNSIPKSPNKNLTNSFNRKQTSKNNGKNLLNPIKSDLTRSHSLQLSKKK